MKEETMRKWAKIAMVLCAAAGVLSLVIFIPQVREMIIGLGERYVGRPLTHEVWHGRFIKWELLFLVIVTVFFTLCLIADASENKNKNSARTSGITATAIFAVTMIALAFLKCAPFGSHSLTWADAEIQYLDFFAYLHDVLHGKAHLSYTFGKTLGGTNVAVFSYYLSSPLNLLVYFFPKRTLHTFFDLLVVLKLSLAGAAFAFYLSKRFLHLRQLFIVLLGICYGLCQYNIAQERNIMWLDGVILLPLILLGVYDFVLRRKSLLLPLSVAMSLAFNWYTGAINCLFAAFFFVFEWALYVCKEGRQFSISEIKKGLLLGLRGAFLMFTGVLLASFLLVPSFVSLRNGRGHADWGLLGNLSLYIEFPSILQGFSLGANSSRTSLSLFSGSLGILGLLGIFFVSDEKVTVRTKFVFGAMTALVALFFCWSPFFLLFSLLKDSSSYWFRYSYIAIFFMLYVSAAFFNIAGAKDMSGLLKPVLVWCAVIALLQYVSPSGSFKYHSKEIYKSIVYCSIFITALIYGASVLVLKKDSSRKNPAPAMILSLLCVGELLTNAILLWYYSPNSVTAFKKYTDETQKVVASIFDSEQGANFRISQTSTRNYNWNENVTANYNESLAFGYNSISGYTSDPDDAQRNFLWRIGYNKMGDNMNIVNTSIVPSDSLLGVKYILSRAEIPGLIKREEFGEADGKTVYENPFYLPFAFAYTDKESPDFNGSSFEYVNALYSLLLGKEVSVFKPVGFTQTENAAKRKAWKLQNIPDGSGAYADINCGWHRNTFLYVNKTKHRYADWICPSVVFVPAVMNSAEILLESQDSFSVSRAQFFAYDTHELRTATDEIRSRSAAEITVTDGFCRFVIDAHNGERLFTSVPYSSGWTVMRNGQKVNAGLFADCLMTIPLIDGKNEIVMKYHVPGLVTGIILTIFGLLLLIIMQYHRALFTAQRNLLKKLGQ